MEQSKSINVRYSMLQGIYYVGFCAVIGYAAVYLGSIGMSSSLIGIVLAIANILTSIEIGRASCRERVCLYV